MVSLQGAVGNAPPAVYDLLDDLARFHYDPLGFVKWAFPWGEPDTALEHSKGPEPWQEDQLARIGEYLRTGGPEGVIIEEDTVSGTGVGKSSLVAWWILWAISTGTETRGVVTAVTESQLRTKTWAELAKWHSLFIANRFFTLTATSIFSAFKKYEKSWRIDAIPWSISNTEGFRGLHNQGKRILVVYDEASGIEDPIWDVSEAVKRDARTQVMWLRFGNPTRTTGKFHHNATRPRGNKVVEGQYLYHNVVRVDARHVSFTNKAAIQELINEHGEDSDKVRVEVRGLFPRSGFSNFISPELVTQARRRRLQTTAYSAYPKILAVDPARFGDDSSVITLRQGLKVHSQVAMQGFDGPDLAGRICDIVKQEGPISCIVYDAIGNGADLDSTLRRIPGLPELIAVMWGQPAKDDKQYFNQRSECWGKMRDFLEGGQIPDDEELDRELTSLDYGYDGRLRIQLESKKDAKRKGVKSPDKADSLALSFVPDLIDRKAPAVVKARPVRRRTVIWTRSNGL